MNKGWILGLILLGASMAPVTAQQPVDVAVVINGQTLDSENPPRMVDGRILIPLRAVFNALGATVKYENKIIEGRRGDKSVILSPGQPTAKINGKDVELDVPPMLIDKVTYVPLRFVASALGDDVKYDAAAKTIIVSPSEPIAESTVPLDRVDVLKIALKRLVVGNQGAILKVWTPTMDEVAYYRGLDDRATAPYSEIDQDSMLGTLGFKNTVEATAIEVMDAYTKLPKREAVAYLGFLHSIPDQSPLDPPDHVDEAMKKFLISTLKEDKDVVIRRQACLALAVSDKIDQEILDAVMEFYAGSENLWETFPVQMFFQFQAKSIRTMPNLAQVRERVAAVNSLYTPAALRFLDGEKE